MRPAGIDMLPKDLRRRSARHPRAERITPGIARPCDVARERGWPVTYANDAHLPADPEGRVWVRTPSPDPRVRR